MKIQDRRAVPARVVPARAVGTGIETGMQRTRIYPRQISRKQISRKLVRVRVAHVTVVVHQTTYYLIVLTRQQDLGINGIGQTSTESSQHYRLKITTISLIRVDPCYKLDLTLIKILLQVMDETTFNGALCKQDGSWLCIMAILTKVYHFNIG